MNPYQPPVPGVAPPALPPPGVEAPTQTWLTIWMVLSVLSICLGCGLLAVLPITLSVIALTKRESDPKLSRTLNRISIVLVCLGFVLLLVSIGLNVATAVMQ
ncbi:MAG: hypothetical protein KC766_27505 [Myxococcales bacterium]|nr:hypothetical protein [Myxococcales bacterium]